MNFDRAPTPWEKTFGLTWLRKDAIWRYFDVAS